MDYRARAWGQRVCCNCLLEVDYETMSLGVAELKRKRWSMTYQPSPQEAAERPQIPSTE